MLQCFRNPCVWFIFPVCRHLCLYVHTCITKRYYHHYLSTCFMNDLLIFHLFVFNFIVLSRFLLFSLFLLKKKKNAKSLLGRHLLHLTVDIIQWFVTLLSTFSSFKIKYTYVGNLEDDSPSALSYRKFDIEVYVLPCIQVCVLHWKEVCALHLTKCVFWNEQKCKLGKPEEFLAGGLDPPQPSSVLRAMSLLREVGACFADVCSLTPLGQHLASLPVNVRIGKMLIYGAILGCLEPVVSRNIKVGVRIHFSH